MTKLNATNKVNREIENHSIEADDWTYSELANELYWWFEVFNAKCFKDQPIDAIALSFANTGVRNLGHFVIGRNDMGIINNININVEYLDLPKWAQLKTLLHEMVHVWEYQYLEEKKRTNNWYHKKDFQNKMKAFGIECEANGALSFIDPKGLFVHLIRLGGVSLEGAVIPHEEIKDGQIKKTKPIKKRKGKSSLKKWSCGCQSVRIGTKEFHATCDLCGNKFELQD